RLRTAAQASTAAGSTTAPRRVRRTEVGGRLRPRTAQLASSRLDRQPVDEIVHRVVAVALDPAEGDVAAAPNLVDERFPQVAIGHRLAGLVHPVARQPSLPPSVAEAVHDIGRVADDLEVAFDGFRGL